MRSNLFLDWIFSGENVKMLLQLKQLTPEEFLQLENSKVYKELLTPKQKFNNYISSIQKRGVRLRKYHFKVIISGQLINVFDGTGKEIGEFENSVSGEKKARAKCFDIFLSAENKNGSFKWLSPNNWEYQNAEELEEQHKRIARELHQEKETRNVSNVKSKKEIVRFYTKGQARKS